MTRRVLVNGESLDHISVFDRGLHYGDGLFETMRVKDGRIPLWPRHWQRLQTGCTRLKMPLPLESDLQKDIALLVDGVAEAVIKLIVTRGTGERGYALPARPQPSCILILTDKAAYPVSHKTEGVRLHLCETRLGVNPSLAGIKHLNRLEQVLARSEWQGQEYQEGLLLDIDGHVIEGTMSNIFWVKNNTLYTPELSGCGVAGVMREIVMQLAQQIDISIKIGLWSITELCDAEEIFITNSLIGIWPVSYILNKTFQAGPVTQQLQAKLQADYAI